MKKLRKVVVLKTRAVSSNGKAKVLKFTLEDINISNSDIDKGALCELLKKIRVISFKVVFIKCDEINEI